MKIASFDDLLTLARQVGPVSIVVVAAHDPEVLRAVDQAQQEGIVRATLIGDWPAIEALSAQTGADLSNATLVHEPDPRQAARRAIRLVREGQAQVVVKGQIKTAELLSAALNRDIGIRRRGLLTHVGVFELPGMDSVTEVVVNEDAVKSDAEPLMIHGETEKEAVNSAG